MNAGLVAGPIGVYVRDMQRATQSRGLRTLVVGLAAFNGVTALAGGLALILWPHGNAYVPIQLLAGTPFSSFSVPGLLLTCVVGGSSLVCALLTRRRHQLAIDVTIFAGGALSVWILAECALLHELRWLQVMYGTIGLMLLAIGVLGAWRSGMPRQRWMVLVTGSEAAGFVVPAVVGLASQRAGVEGWPQVAALTAAGFLEGLMLGTGQAFALPIAVRKPRYAILTAFGAASVWMLVMATIEQAPPAHAMPTPVAIGALAVVALVGLTAIGAAQWIELRRHASGSARWIGWTALAWIAALPLSFTPSPLVNETTPIATHVVLWSCAGLLMAYTMALVTWQGARRLRHTHAIESSG